MTLRSALASLLVLVLLAGAPAQAFMEFNKVFLAEYIDKHSDEEFQKLVKEEAKCLVCHQGKSKKHRNVFGQYVGKLIGKDDKKDTDKIKKSLQEVAEMPSVADDPESITFGELIADSKLPGGTLEELQQEPEKEEK